MISLDPFFSSSSSSAAGRKKGRHEGTLCRRHHWEEEQRFGESDSREGDLIALNGRVLFLLFFLSRMQILFSTSKVKMGMEKLLERANK